VYREVLNQLLEARRELEALRATVARQALEIQRLTRKEGL
jgi:predicted component of type VI protein secretion system